MLRRDFSKSNREYFSKNKIWLIALTCILTLGLVIGLVFGMNTNYELSGYNEFTISITEAEIDKYSDYSKEIEHIVNLNGGECDTISLFGEGDNSKIVVRYMNKLNTTSISNINDEIVDAIDIEISSISEHVIVSPVVKQSDYIYTAATILLLVVIASLFAYFRYNGASAVSIILACIVGTMTFMAISSILRLTIGMSYFAMLVILNVLIVYFAIDIFEHMHSTSWLSARDFGSAMDDSLNHNKFRICVVSVLILAIGVLFVLLAPTNLKYLSLNIMFLAVTNLATVWYIIPFVWSVLIPHSRQKNYQVKSTEEDIKNNNEI